MLRGEREVFVLGVGEVMGEVGRLEESLR
jgi:hypothetical protein